MYKIGDKVETEEIIKPLNGFEGLYEISNLGYVIGVERIIEFKNTKRHIKRHINKNIPNPKNKYIYVYLFKNNKNYAKRLHRLLAEHFIPNPENKPNINHIDGNRQNNNLSNLEWVTSKENSRHMYDVLGFKTPREKIDKMRESQKGEKHHKSKLKEEQVLEIRKKLKDGYSELFLAKEYGVAPNNIHCIKINKIWKHVLQDKEKE